MYKILICAFSLLPIIYSSTTPLANVHTNSVFNISNIITPNHNDCLPPDALKVHFNWKSSRIYYNVGRNDGVLAVIPIQNAGYPCIPHPHNNGSRIVYAVHGAGEFLRGVEKAVAEAIKAPKEIWDNRVHILPSFRFMITHPKDAAQAFEETLSHSCTSKKIECSGVIVGNVALLFLTFGVESMLELGALAAGSLRVIDAVHIAGITNKVGERINEGTTTNKTVPVNGTTIQ